MCIRINDTCQGINTVFEQSEPNLMCSETGYPHCPSVLACQILTIWDTSVVINSKTSARSTKSRTSIALRAWPI